MPCSSPVAVCAPLWSHSTQSWRPSCAMGSMTRSATRQRLLCRLVPPAASFTWECTGWQQCTADHWSHSRLSHCESNARAQGCFPLWLLIGARQARRAHQLKLVTPHCYRTAEGLHAISCMPVALQVKTGHVDTCHSLCLSAPLPSFPQAEAPSLLQVTNVIDNTHQHQEEWG